MTRAAERARIVRLLCVAAFCLGGCGGRDLVIPPPLVPAKCAEHDETHFPFDDERPVDEVVMLPGDEVAIAVTSGGNPVPDCSATFRVPERGLVKYPYLGETQVRGQTLGALKEKILKRLRGSVLAEPTVTADFVNFARRVVTLQGPFSRPGDYPLNPLKKHSLALMVFQGGRGFRKSADRHRLVLRRQERFRIEDKELNFCELADNPNQKFILEPGDVLQARNVEPIRIMGAVKDPKYELAYPDKALRLYEAIQMVGGPTRFADTTAIEVRRKGRDGKVGIIVANYDDILNNPVSTHNLELAPGDIVQVKETPY